MRLVYEYYLINSVVIYIHKEKYDEFKKNTNDNRYIDACINYRIERMRSGSF